MLESVKQCKHLEEICVDIVNVTDDRLKNLGTARILRGLFSTEPTFTATV